MVTVTDRHPDQNSLACLTLEQHLTQAVGQEGYVMKVYAFQTPGDGFRVAEVDLVAEDGSSGTSWMRGACGVFGLALILACEDFVRTFGLKPYTPEGWESEIDEHADAVYVLDDVVRELKRA